MTAILRNTKRKPVRRIKGKLYKYEELHTSLELVSFAEYSDKIWQSQQRALTAQEIVHITQGNYLTALYTHKLLSKYHKWTVSITAHLKSEFDTEYPIPFEITLDKPMSFNQLMSDKETDMMIVTEDGEFKWKGVVNYWLEQLDKAVLESNQRFHCVQANCTVSCSEWVSYV